MKTEQVALLSSWISHWEAQKAYRAEDSELAKQVKDALSSRTVRTPPANKSTMVEDFDSDIAVGQIRHMSPWLFAEHYEYARDMQDYLVVVVQEWIGDMYLVAPFGKFEVPATTGELKLTEERPRVSNVISVWCASTISSPTLRQSWKVGTVTSQEIEDIKHVVRHTMTGIALPEHLLSRVGAQGPYHPADYRHEYLEEEKNLFGHMLLADKAWATC